MTKARFAIVGSRGYPSYYSGFETLVRHLAPFLALHGHEVTVYGRDRPRGTVRDPADPDRQITIRNTWGIDRKTISTLSFGLTATIDLARRGCDSALVLNVAHGYYLRHLSKAGIATYVNVDGLEWTRGKWGTLGRQAFRTGAALTARHADGLVMDSEALNPIWLDRFGREGTFIPYGAEVLSDVASNRLIDAKLPTEGYVLAVARIVPENNIDLLLDAVELLKSNVEVIIVGDSNYEHDTVRRLRVLAAKSRVRWLGRIDDQELLQQLWGNAGIYWHGHSVGGTNPSLLQALGAGAPTLALDTVFNREVIGRDDQLMQPNPALIANAIKSVLNSDSIARQMSRVGRELIALRYSWDHVCNQYEQLLSSSL